LSVEKIIITLQNVNAMKHARNVDKCNSLNSVDNHVRSFSTWRTKTGSSAISPSIRHSTGPCKELFYRFRTSDDMYANSVDK